MDARTKRTVLRLLSVFLAAGAGDALIQFSASTTYDWHHLAAALVAAGIVAAEQYLKDSTSLAAPTVAAVNEALQLPVTTVSTSTSGVPPTTIAGPARMVAPPSVPPA